MAKNDDTDCMLPMENPQDPSLLPALPMEVSSIRILNSRVSDNGQSLIVIEEIRLNLEAINKLAHLDEYRQQAQNICRLFARYIDRHEIEELCRQLVNMLSAGIIEYQQGCQLVNIPMGKGQAEFVRLILNHMTQQRRKTIGEKQPFNELKHLLLEHMRHQGQRLHINSISVTLRRAINSLNTPTTSR